MRIAVVTPYHDEDDRTLERCLDSVANQTLAADHFLVSDGPERPWASRAAAHHLALGRAHGDFGNTPRGLGAQLAVAEGCNAVAFLDADNWYDPDHLALCLDAARATTGRAMDCDYVVARRRFRRYDDRPMALAEEPGHIDTNCLLLLPGAFSALPLWCLMPREVSVIGDRIFAAHLEKAQLVRGHTARATVNYVTLWPEHYRAVGETPPADARPEIPVREIETWIEKLSEQERDILRRLCGLSIERGMSP